MTFYTEGHFFMSVSLQLNNPKTIRAWCMYDWANSVYSLVITSAIFPIYFNEVAVVTKGSKDIPFMGYILENSVLYSYFLSLSFFIVAIILPILSGVADYAGKKKLFMKIFAVTGSLACMGLIFFRGMDTLGLGLLFMVLASIGYSGSLVFYDAFLPEIVTRDRFDMTSAKGYSMGYYGSVILMVMCIAIIINHDALGITGSDGGLVATRMSFLLTGLWWLGFSMLAFRGLPDNPYGMKPEGKIWSKGYEELIKVWRSLKSSPDLKRYLLAFFFFNMGVQTVMYLATFFAEKELKLPSDNLILAVLLIQLVGAVGAYLFARISKSKGNKSTLLIMISIWICVCVGAYFIQTEIQFYLLAVVVGMVMGGIQALSRATYSKLIPESTIDHASYFSFFDVTFNLSIVCGIFSYGFINQITGSMRNSALALGLFFIIGMVVLMTVKSRAIINED